MSSASATHASTYLFSVEFEFLLYNRKYDARMKSLDMNSLEDGKRDERSQTTERCQ
ncbi:hypothetical protein BDC45DRAFT_577169 [Circinella umbellata]|nr:hypothetical protein BDC45DRAFT_577169 [Circinella umbellata]